MDRLAVLTALLGIATISAIQVDVSVDTPKAIAGDNIRVTCRVTGAQKDTLVYWYKEVMVKNKAIVEQISINTHLQTPYNLFKDRYIASFGEEGVDKTLYLDIKGATLADTGNYQCTSSDDQNVIGQATLDVYSPVTEIRINNGTADIKNGTTLYFIEGDKMNMTCHASGSIPAPQVMITAGDRDITSDFVMEEETILNCGEGQGSGKTCIIHNTHSVKATHRSGFQARYEDDGKMLVCAAAIAEAGDMLPTRAVSALIDVHFAPRVSCQFMSNYPLHAPNVRIECVVEAKPGITKDDVMWRWPHGDQMVELVAGETFEDISARFRPKEGNLYLATLEFKQLRERHFDHPYTLNVTNSVGSYQKNIKLEMKEIEVKTTPRTEEIKNDAGTPSWSSFWIAITVIYIGVILTKA